MEFNSGFKGLNLILAASGVYCGTYLIGSYRSNDNHKIKPKRYHFFFSKTKTEYETRTT